MKPGVGCCFTCVLKELADVGHRVLAISPDSVQVGLARAANAQRSRVRVECSKLEDMTAARFGVFDVIIFQESAKYIDPSPLFERVHQLRAPDGRVVMVDEFTLVPEAPGPVPPPRVADVLAQAQRFGFAITKERNLSPQAAPTLDYLLRHLSEQRDRLARSLAMPDQAIDALSAALRVYRAEYERGRFRYMLFSFARQSAGTPQIPATARTSA